ncbi:TPA: PilT/PilU family type 4a pilus ATPase [Candidatus Galligastranaerophilus gallistercoris]|nr:PilT/PilU family type 4a pilus ATPase [Candidatus Galligastranaerophilus gallistercoris]
MFSINEFLSKITKVKASDVHLMMGKQPSLRVSGDMVRIDMPALTEDDFDNILQTVLHKDMHEKIKDATDLDFTYELKGVSRYRVNYCKDLGMPKLTMRLIPYEIPTFEDLMLPPSINHFTEFNNGILLITGATGSGKSTTIASMLENINKTQRKHIITIEDPIEFLYSDKNCLITQRGLGLDVESFPSGIKYALRQDPDIIVIGEIRDKETVEAAIAAAETGHFVLSTIHTNSATQTINRIIGLFDSDQKDFIRKRLAITLKGTIAQKLLPKTEGGLVPALEIMTSTPAIADYIAKDKMSDIEQLIAKANSPTLCTMNSSIYNLYKLNLITKETAIESSDNPTELYQMMRGIYHGLSDPNSTDLI